MVIVIESPSKIKNIKSYVKAEVVATCGHFRDLPKDALGVELTTYKPALVYSKNRDGSDKGGKISAQLKKHAKGEDVYIATDPDREGYAIAMSVYYEIRTIAKRIYRLDIYELTDKGIRDAFRRATPFHKTNFGLFRSYLGRRVGDRLVGYLLSSIAKAALKPTLQEGEQVSVGRVKAPAVRLCVEREREIAAFQPATFYVVNILLEQGGVESKVTYTGGNFYNRSSANALVAAVANQPARVIRVNTRKVYIKPRAPFTTAELLASASNQFGISPETTMRICQDLFHGGRGRSGLITYPRTDSVRIANDFIAEIRNFVDATMGRTFLPDAPRRYVSSSSQGDAHEGIRLTTMHGLGAIPQLIDDAGLTDDHARLYSLIWRRIVASQMAPAIYEETTLEIECGGNIFRSTCRKLKFDGFLSVYQGGCKEKLEKVPNLTVLGHLGEFVKRGAELVEMETAPPQRYTEGQLIRALEQRGIGRPSTYASIIGAIRGRGYIQIVNNMIQVTPLGERLYDYLITEHPWIMDLSLTKRMEEYLDQVEAETGRWDAFVKALHHKIGFAQPW